MTECGTAEGVRNERKVTGETEEQKWKKKKERARLNRLKWKTNKWFRRIEYAKIILKS